jgi:hypothetical protein
MGPFFGWTWEAETEGLVAKLLSSGFRVSLGTITSCVALRSISEPIGYWTVSDV